MYRLWFLLNTLLFRSCHFLQPFWGSCEWQHIGKFFAGKDLFGVVKRLEEEVLRLTGAKYALGLNLGRSAIQLALESFSFPPKSEVIIPSFSCTGVIMPVIQAGLEPVLADIDQHFNPKAESIEQALSPRTRAIILPHLSGKWAHDTEPILKIAAGHGLKVIEDASQAFGLQRHRKWAGTLGDVGIFSFGLGKNLFGPGGGMLITNDEMVISYCKSQTLGRENLNSVRRRVANFIYSYQFPRLKFLERCCRNILKRSWKSPTEVVSPKRFTFPVYQISDIEAALSWCQMCHYQEIIERRQTHAEALLASWALAQTGLDLPEPNDHIFTKFLISTDKERGRAMDLREWLHASGIETELSYTPLHLRPAFSSFRRTSLPETEKRWMGAFSIPVNPRLNLKEVSRIISVVERFEKKRHFGTKGCEK
jgi:dTDP-4-amino-4,6-dideoxygalactose transaminase